MARIRYGLRRYSLLVAVFGILGTGMLVWAQRVTEPTFVFPFGRLGPETASWVLSAVGLCAYAYVLAVSYVRFVRHPHVIVGKKKIEIPIGEFGGGRVLLRSGDVFRVDEQRTRGGWRVLHVRHRGGNFILSSAQLPDDDAFDRVRDKLYQLAVPE